METETDNVELNAYSWVALAIFLAALVFVIRPFEFSLPKIGWRLYLNLATAPPLGVLILLASKTIDWINIRDGLLGHNIGVEPYAIMLLFYSLAYLCISLDLTGLIQFCAFWVSKRAGNRGHMAFSLFFIMTSLISGLASNDVVVLTGTAFLSYFTRVSDIQPTAFLMSEFTSANIASMALYIGNPTNVVIAEAFNMSFITYSAWMLLPTFICLGIAYLALRVVFHSQKYLPSVIHPPEEEPQAVLVDPKGAIFGLVLLGVCLCTLIGTSFVHGVSVWMVTLPFAVVMLLRDVWYDLTLQWKKKAEPIPSSPKSATENNEETTDDDDDITTTTTTTTAASTTAANHRQLRDNNITSVSSEQDITAMTSIEMIEMATSDESPVRQRSTAVATGTAASRSNSRHDVNNKHNDDIATAAGTDASQDELPITTNKAIRNRFMNVLWKFRSRLPTMTSVLARMPWKILPFALSMFVLVEGLSEVGWIGICATAMVSVARNDYVSTVFGVMGISLLACQLLNNLPMTILFTRILQHPNFAQHAGMSDIVTQAAVLGLVVGSNLGACLTLVGSLAGIM
ncbi:citrate transporter-domain-containing protein [Zychaea mexicana]|uniref:citrate transporter-domain-containing protein n=1 Tax=Zychaea mexicana TaxID=64656 RepID=UPI0022FE0B47|nr:citrate transporter-domain-containing protein [Zychaea mexicana]KAI9496025.1 citrate transporter-domain-containing protein [Zychaea mexicana]